MPVTIQCPNPECGRSFSVAEQDVGRRGRCKACGTVFTAGASDRSHGSSGIPRGGSSSPSAVRHDDIPKKFGRFVIERRLGSGNFGTVYLTRDTILGRLVALKVPGRELRDDPNAVERFMREATSAGRLHHPNIVPVYNVGVEDGVPFIASAYIAGRSLEEAVAGGAFEPGRASRSVAELADALDFAHRHGVVHRDVKPANILLDEGDRPHLTDFGLALCEGSGSRLTVQGTLLGTPAYMSPEQAMGRGDRADAASDQYALGATLYELLCGEPPFGGLPQVVVYHVIHSDPRRPSEVRPGVPAGLEEICLKALSKSPAARYESCRAMADALRRRPWYGAGPGPSHRRLRSIRAIILGSLALVVAAALAMMIASVRRSTPASAPDDLARRASAASPRTVPTPISPVERVKTAALQNTENSLKMKLVLIPSGEFMMGTDEEETGVPDNEKPSHRVRITRPFWLGATEVTQGQYQLVTGATPSFFKKSDDLPVENVSWYDAIAFCNRLSEREGLTPYYQFGASSRSGGAGYRLPTEAEWEYACRGGSGGTGVYSFGDDASELGEYAWCTVNFTPGIKTHPVGRRRANGFGLYDMYGNVWEWCWDGYDAGCYRSSPETDPPGILQAPGRVNRGGCWHDNPPGIRSAVRNSGAPDYRSYDLGFRVARDAS